MGWTRYLREIFAEPLPPTEEPPRCLVCGSVAIHDGNCPGRAEPLRSGITVPRRSYPTPSRDAFRAWRDDPVTQFAFAALREASDAQSVAWAEASWDGGNADEKLLLELRTRADAYKSLEEADYEGFCEWLGVEPEPLRGEE